MATEAGLRRIVTKRILYLTQVRAIAAEGFDTVRDPSCCVRRMDVVKYVAIRLRRQPGSRLCADVRAAVASLGWGAVDTGGRAYYCNVKPRGVTDAKARKATKEDKRRAINGPRP